MTTDISLLPDRMLEQVEPWTAWDRRAWEPGTLLRMRELSEATRWVDLGVLSDGAFTWLKSSLQPVLGQDQGLGRDAVRTQLQELLRRGIPYRSQAHRRLDTLTEFASESYLREWRRALTSTSGVDVERASRFITGHVLDGGYHTEWLRSRTKEAVKDGATAVDLIDVYIDLLGQPSRSISGFVALLDVPVQDLMSRSDKWLPPDEVARRLRTRTMAHPMPRHVGGLQFQVEARDPRSAAAAVAEMMDRLVARTRFLRSRKCLRYHPRFYCEDGSDYELAEARPTVSVMSLVKTGVLYSASLTDERSNAVDDALQLAAHLMDGPSTVAAAGSWAALESLLATGADNTREVGRAVAADRAASLVAAAWPRAELTRLSYRTMEASTVDARLLAELSAVGEENIARCEVMLNWIQAGRPIATDADRDRAAVERMTALVQNPRQVLTRVRKYMTCAFRRLYRQRNLVLHGGAASPIALPASIRTSGPLVGAALDRLSHAFELEGIEPLDAVARAECAIDAVGSKDGWRLHELAV